MDRIPSYNFLVGLHDIVTCYLKKFTTVQYHVVISYMNFVAALNIHNQKWRQITIIFSINPPDGLYVSLVVHILNTATAFQLLRKTTISYSYITCFFNVFFYFQCSIHNNKLFCNNKRLFYPTSYMKSIQFLLALQILN